MSKAEQSRQTPDANSVPEEIAPGVDVAQTSWSTPFAELFGMHSRSWARAMIVIQGTLLTGGIFGLIGLGRFVQGGIAPAGRVWWYPLTAAVSVAAAALVYIRHQRNWLGPSRRLRELTSMAREGVIPIDEVSRKAGHLLPLAETICDVLRDLRQQRAEVAALEAEVRRKVENRTQALERQISTLKTQASRDALTGLFNRRELERTLPELVATSQQGRTLSLLMIDVDYFKTLNDTRGHAAGDEFLKTLGQLIRSSIRPEDYAYRLGGDEFVIALPDSGKNTATQVADRLVEMVEQYVKPWRMQTPPGLSIGILSSRELGAAATATEMLKVADGLLYEAKSARKSRRAG